MVPGFTADAVCRQARRRIARHPHLDTHDGISRLGQSIPTAFSALIGAGGMVMAYISGGELMGHYPFPSVDLLRMSNDLGFALAGVAGSWAAGDAVATLSIQGYAAGVFGARMRAFGVLTAFALLLAMLFVPIGALFLWVLIAAVMWIRRPRRPPGARRSRLNWEGAAARGSPLTDSSRRPPQIVAEHSVQSPSIAVTAICGSCGIFSTNAPGKNRTCARGLGSPPQWFRGVRPSPTGRS